MRVLVVDDEELARQAITRHLRSIPDVVVIGESRDGYEAVEAIQDLAPDMVCLDVQMPGLDGFGVIAALDGIPLPAIVFVTAHDEYAIRAFRVHAVDYLLKPVGCTELHEAVARVRERIEGAADASAIRSLIRHASGNPPAEPARYLQRILVRRGDRVLFVRTNSIRYIESADNYLRIHTDDGQYLVRSTMRQMETRLDPDRFARVHRRTIVALDRIFEVISPSPGEYDIRLTDGTAHRLGRSHRDAFFSRAR